MLRKFGAQLLLLVLFLVTGCDSSSKPASVDEVSKLIDALRAAGCTGLLGLKSESEGYEVWGASCGDENRYEVKLDKNFAVVSKRKDWF